MKSCSSPVGIVTVIQTGRFGFRINKDLDPEPKGRYNNERTTQVLEDTNLHSKSPIYGGYQKHWNTCALMP